MSDKFSKLQNYQKMNSRMTICPIVKQKVMVSGLTVGDDINIRTMIGNPDVYDQELSTIMFNHTTFPDFPTQPTYDDFVANIAHSDRKMILWAIYAATYKTIKGAVIQCPECSTSIEKNIDVENLMKEDTVQVWQEDKPFSSYEYTFEYKLNDSLKLVLHLILPSIGDHLKLLKTISLDEMKSNFERFESILSKTDELLLMIRQIDIVDDDGTDTITDISDIKVCIDRFIPFNSQEAITESYNEKFSKYDPKFNYSCDCTNEDCNHKISFDIDIETMLFKRFLDL